MKLFGFTFPSLQKMRNGGLSKLSADTCGVCGSKNTEHYRIRHHQHWSPYLRCIRCGKFTAV